MSFCRRSRWLALSFLVLVTRPSLAASGDTTDARGNGFFELGGPNALYSVGYEHALGDRWTARVGLSGFGFTSQANDIVWGLATMSGQRLFGGPVHRWEASVGFTGGLVRSNDALYRFVIPVVSGAYRYEPHRSRWLVRLGLLAAIGGRVLAPWGTPVTPWFTAAVGFRL